MYIESLAPKLKKTRIESGFTQQQVANYTNISQSTIARFEKGNRIPDSEQLATLADFYEISTDWLLGTKGSKK